MKKFILIADDEPHIVDLIKLSLGDEYEFAEATDGKEVLKLVAQRKPDLLLLDVMMPTLDGYEVCRRLRQNPETKDTLIAMVSAKKEDHDILTGIDKGAIAYITKPFSPVELQEKVRDLLQL
jgi:CheY-like chemotaxis protein